MKNVRSVALHGGISAVLRSPTTTSPVELVSDGRVDKAYSNSADLTELKCEAIDDFIEGVWSPSGDSDESGLSSLENLQELAEETLGEGWSVVYSKENSNTGVHYIGARKGDQNLRIVEYPGPSYESEVSLTTVAETEGGQLITHSITSPLPHGAINPEHTFESIAWHADTGGSSAGNTPASGEYVWNVKSGEEITVTDSKTGEMNNLKSDGLVEKRWKDQVSLESIFSDRLAIFVSNNPQRAHDEIKVTQSVPEVLGDDWKLVSFFGREDQPSLSVRNDNQELSLRDRGRSKGIVDLELTSEVEDSNGQTWLHTIKAPLKNNQVLAEEIVEAVDRKAAP